MCFSRYDRLGGIATIAAFFCLCSAFIAPARAESPARSVQVLLKAARFMTPAPTGDVAIAIIYAANDMASQQEAEQIKAVIAADSGSTFKPMATLTEAAQVSGLSARIAILPASLSPAVRADVAEAVRGRRILTASTDQDCAQAGQCVLATSDGPRAMLLLNATAAEAAGIEFVPTFRMMVTQL